MSDHRFGRRYAHEHLGKLRRDLDRIRNLSSNSDRNPLIDAGIDFCITAWSVVDWIAAELDTDVTTLRAELAQKHPNLVICQTIANENKHRKPRQFHGLETVGAVASAKHVAVFATAMSIRDSFTATLRGADGETRTFHSPITMPDRAELEAVELRATRYDSSYNLKVIFLDGRRVDALDTFEGVLNFLESQLKGLHINS